MKRILLLIALLGFGTGAYVLLRPATSQVVRLEAITPLPSQLEQPAPNVQASNQPVSTIKPRPTKPIEPRRTPVIQSPAPTRETVKPVTTRETEKPVTTQESEKPLTTQETEKPLTTLEPKKPANAVTLPITLTVRQDAGTWRIQAGAFRTQSNAAALQNKIQDSGLTARVIQGDDGIYRVLVGNYNSSDAARADSDKVSSVIR